MIYGVSRPLQSLVRAIYPPQCALCYQLTEEDFALCPSCWSDAALIAGTVCDACGAALIGEDDGRHYCDACLSNPRPWSRGRAALAYSGSGRRMVLSLKYSDRTEIARTAAKLMMGPLRVLGVDDPLLVPVPLHYFRMLGRRYNQAALLARALARQMDRRDAYVPDALVRIRNTKPLKGTDPEARFAALQGAIQPASRRGAVLKGRNIVLIDDVMTSGATLSASTAACFAAGARSVCVLVLARAGKEA